jgi:hypothetical protein
MSAAYLRRCAGKNRHEQRGGACGERAHICAKHKISKDRLSVYRCDQCLGWHVGGAGGAFISRKRTGKRPNRRMRGRV